MKKLFVILGLAGICLFFLPEVSAQNFGDEASFVDGLYDETVAGEKTPMPLPSIREADVMWKKTVWREIDFMQKMNQGFYFPIEPHTRIKNLYTILDEALADPTSGVIAYKLMNTDELKDTLSYNGVKKLTSERRVKKHQNQYGDVVGEEIVYDRISSNQIMRCRVKEEWYFDKQRSQLLVKIIAICPVRVYKKDGSDELQKEPLYWVPYDSNLRKILVEAPFYNRYNSAARLNYDEVFSKRLFDSYITKEENMYDRAIAEMYEGVDALKESERIKQSIIDFEQNLWEY